MKFNVKAENIDICPNDKYGVNCTIECDTSDILDQLTTAEIISEVGSDTILGEIGECEAASYFGENIISNFDINDVLSIYPIEEIINHIGEDAFKSYIRDIMIDKII